MEAGTPSWGTVVSQLAIGVCRGLENVALVLYSTEFEGKAQAFYEYSKLTVNRLNDLNTYITDSVKSINLEEQTSVQKKRLRKLEDDCFSLRSVLLDTLRAGKAGFNDPRSVGQLVDQGIIQTAKIAKSLIVTAQVPGGL